MNVAVSEAFTRESPYVIRRVEGLGGAARYEILEGGEVVTRVQLAPRPAWYDRRTRTGKAMRRIGTLQGTYLAVYPANVCHFWVKGPQRPARENCRFCSVGLNLGVDEEIGKSVDEVLEVVHAARRESHVTYVDFNTGHYDGSDFLSVLSPYVRRVKEETGLLVGVQTPPFADPAGYARLRQLGVNRVSFCFELFDRERFEATCPGKARVYGLDGYLEAIEAAAALAPRRSSLRSPWVVNGELIAGLEDPARSIQAIEWLTARGAIPTVCVFRPLKGTNLEDASPPTTASMVPVFQALWARCMERGLPIGVAPGIHVSLVLLPDEARWLVQDADLLARLASRERRRRLHKTVFGAAFRARLAWRRARAPMRAS
ncbi:MAG: radical SAM protein [Planctomycetota bacterium]